MYWTILHKAGFEVDETKLPELKTTNDRTAGKFNPGYSRKVRDAAYGEEEPPLIINTLDELQRELDLIARLLQQVGADDKIFQSSGESGRSVIESDDKALLKFLNPISRGSSGVSMIQQFRDYHSPGARNFTDEIIELLDNGKTVILDLGNADPDIRKYFSNQLAETIYYHQVDKFSNNALGSHYIQLYFEEAHNLFPPVESYTRKAEELSIYNKIAKEGAKYHIGMVYATQSVTSIDKDLVNQREFLYSSYVVT